ncbi:MAG: hypothetical protein R3A78_13950 [Polyangiales bacterium]|nr:hypothetical protein [Myxococcales bacterium]
MHRPLFGSRFFAVSLAAAVVFIALPALAQDTPPPVGPASSNPPPVKYEDYGRQDDSPVDWTIYPEYERKEGLFLRFAGGFGYNAAWQTVNKDSQTYAGAGFALAFDIGGFVASNLALGAEFSTTFVPSPSVEVNGKGIGQDTAIQLTNFYFAVNYYIPRIDVFLAAGAGLGFESETGAGPAFKVAVGKEWAVGGGWGIGVALQCEYANLPNGSDADGNVRFNSLTPSVVFTVSKW